MLVVPGEVDGIICPDAHIPLIELQTFPPSLSVATFKLPKSFAPPPDEIVTKSIALLSPLPTMYPPPNKARVAEEQPTSFIALA